MNRREALYSSVGMAAATFLGTSVVPSMADFEEQQNTKLLIKRAKEPDALYADLDVINQRVLWRFYLSCAEIFIAWLSLAAIRDLRQNTHSLDQNSKS